MQLNDLGTEMKKLLPAVENRLRRFPPPIDHKEFETLCVDVFEYVLKERKIPILNKAHTRISTYGTSGDKQYGIDVRDPATLAVAQCKKEEVITPGKLQKELDKLFDYEKDVSHYFFVIKHDFVKTTLSDWVDDKNAEAQNERNDSTPYPCRPSIALPELHILGWDELRSYLGQSTFLLWKWQVCTPVGQNFHLEGLDVKALDLEVRRYNKKIDPAEDAPSLEAVHAFESLFETIYVDDLRAIGKSPLIHVGVINGIQSFLDAMKETYRVICTYDEAITKIDKRDLVVVEQGYQLLNDLARQKARIAAFPYLRNIRNSCRRLIQILTARGFSDWEPEFITDEFGEEHEVDGGTFLRYNFNIKKSRSNLGYTDPNEVTALTHKIVSEINDIKQYQ